MYGVSLTVLFDCVQMRMFVRPEEANLNKVVIISLFSDMLISVEFFKIGMYYNK